MRRIISVFLTVSIMNISLPIHSYATNNGEALIWSASPVRPSLNLGNSYSHIDASKKIKWYVWDLENKYFLSNKQPFTIRVAKEVKIVDKSANCVDIPVNIRRELSEKEATDPTNQTYIEFFQADFGFNKSISPSQIASRPIIHTINYSSWKGKLQEEIVSYIPICRDSIGKSISDLMGNEITLNFRVAYSSILDENLVNIEPKCTQILGGKCIFYSAVTRIFGVKLNLSSLDLQDLRYAYQETIDKDKDYLQAKPCDIPYASYDQQSNVNIMVKDSKALCESAQRNLDFLNLEIAKALKPLQPIPSTTTSPKLVNITCIKGKTTKKVSGTNPKCPKGYKVKA